jgi:serine protease
MRHRCFLRHIFLFCMIAVWGMVLGCYVPPDPPPPGDSDEDLRNSSLAGRIQLNNFTAASAHSSVAQHLYQNIKQGAAKKTLTHQSLRRVQKQKSPFKKGELVFFFDRGQWTALDLQKIIQKTMSSYIKGSLVRVPHCTAHRFCLVKLFDQQHQSFSLQETIRAKHHIAHRHGSSFRHITYNDIMRPLLNANDTFYPYQWNLSSARLQSAWDITTGADDIVVAVVDSGILPEHPDIIGRLVQGVDLIEDVGMAGDGNGRDTDPTDVGDNMFGSGQHSYHGSHVAGIIGAASNNDLGITGVMWSGKILPVRVLGVGGGTQYDILSGVYWALGEEEVSGVPENTTPARIVNLSLGGEVDSDTYEAWQTELAYILSQETLYGKPIIVAAAGNEDQDVVNVTLANIDAVITVGAIKFDNLRANYSNWGAQIDIMAPGGLTSVDQNGDGQPDGIYSFYGTDYRWEHGTSMATPHVSGILGLALAINPGLNQAQAQQLLYDSADQSGECNEGCGAGLVNAGSLALTLTGGHIPEPTPRLAIDTDRVVFYQSQNASTVNIFNLGGGSLSYSARILGGNASLFSVSPTSGSIGAATGIALNVTLARGDLTEGEAELTVEGVGESADQSKTIPISFRDVVPVENNLQVALIEAFEILESGEIQSEGESTYARRSEAFDWRLDELTSGSYYVFAVGDDNNDGVFDSETESFGAYPNTASPQPITVIENQLVKGVDFALSFSNGTLVEGVGTPCQVDSDCSFFTDGECIIEWPGGYCSRYCDDGNCGLGGICVEIECGDELCSICLSGCNTDADCRSNAGYVCDAYNTCTPSGF